MGVATVHAFLDALKSCDPRTLPVEPHSFSLLSRADSHRLGEMRCNLAAKYGRSVAERVCYRCSRIFRPAHKDRVNCDICCSVRKILAK